LADACLLGVVSVPDAVVFWLFAVMAVAGALGVVTLANPVYCALSLAGTLVSVAVLFLMNAADFVAAVQVIVYAGAVVVFFLFVVMLLGVDRAEPWGRERLAGQRVLGILAAGAVLGLLLVLATSAAITGQRSLFSMPASRTGITVALSRLVFTSYLLPFEATALLLLVVVIGAVFLVKRGGIALGGQDVKGRRVMGTRGGEAGSGSVQGTEQRQELVG
jgi:NADH-quinone oxidoreductase subunit J